MTSIKVGVIGLPAIAQALTSAGYEVVTGPDYSASAQAVMTAHLTGEAVPILVGDTPDRPAAMTRFLRARADHTDAIAVVALGGDGSMAQGLNVQTLTPPLSIGDLLEAIRVDLAWDSPLYNLTFGPDGSLSGDAPVATPAPPPTFEQAPALAPAPLPTSPSTPAVEQSAPAPVPAPLPVTGGEPNLFSQSSPIPGYASAPAPLPTAPAAPLPTSPATPDLFSQSSPIPGYSTAPAPQPVAQPTPVPAVEHEDEDEEDAGPVDLEHLFTDPEPEPVAQPAPLPQPAPIPQPVPAPVHEHHAAVAPPVLAPAAPVRPYVEEDVEPTTAAPAATAPILDSASIFAGESPRTAAQAFGEAGPSTVRRQGKVIIVIAAKGGVGKSTVSACLAQYAADHGENLRSALVDGNRGQGNQRRLLGLNSAVPSVYDAALDNDPSVAIIRPTRINATREAARGKVSFAVALAPPNGATDSQTVTASVYRDVVEHARTLADVVVVDTQIMEDTDTSRLFDEVWLPLLVQDAWVVGITGADPDSWDDLLSRVNGMLRLGIPRNRILVVGNERKPETAGKYATLGGGFDQVVTYLGAIDYDAEIEANNQTGIISSENAHLRPILNDILHRVTRRPEFDPATQVAERGPGLVGRLVGRLRRGGGQ